MKFIYISALVLFGTQAVTLDKKPESNDLINLNLDVETEELP